MSRPGAGRQPASAVGTLGYLSLFLLLQLPSCRTRQHASAPGASSAWHVEPALHKRMTGRGQPMAKNSLDYGPASTPLPQPSMLDPSSGTLLPFGGDDPPSPVVRRSSQSLSGAEPLDNPQRPAMARQTSSNDRAKPAASRSGATTSQRRLQPTIRQDSRSGGLSAAAPAPATTTSQRQTSTGESHVFNASIPPIAPIRTHGTRPGTGQRASLTGEGDYYPDEADERCSSNQRATTSSGATATGMDRPRRAAPAASSPHKTAAVPSILAALPGPHAATSTLVGTAALLEAAQWAPRASGLTPTLQSNIAAAAANRRVTPSSAPLGGGRVMSAALAVTAAEAVVAMRERFALALLKAPSAPTTPRQGATGGAYDVFHSALSSTSEPAGGDGLQSARGIGGGAGAAVKRTHMLLTQDRSSREKIARAAVLQASLMRSSRPENDDDGQLRPNRSESDVGSTAPEHTGGGEGGIATQTSLPSGTSIWAKPPQALEGSVASAVHPHPPAQEKPASMMGKLYARFGPAHPQPQPTPPPGPPSSSNGSQSHRGVVQPQSFSLSLPPQSIPSATGPSGALLSARTPRGVPPSSPPVGLGIVVAPSGASFSAGGSQALKAKGAAQLSSYDVVLWMGDLNYRINANVDSVLHLIEEDLLEVLFANDQLQQQQKKGKAFQGFVEQEICFPPTFKYEQHSHKYSLKRVPSWTDRILYLCNSAAEFAHLRPLYYNAVRELTSSDHRPVCAGFELIVQPNNFVPTDGIAAVKCVIS